MRLLQKQKNKLISRLFGRLRMNKLKLWLQRRYSRLSTCLMILPLHCAFLSQPWISRKPRYQAKSDTLLTPSSLCNLNKEIRTKEKCLPINNQITLIQFLIKQKSSIIKYHLLKCIIPSKIYQNLKNNQNLKMMRHKKIQLTHLLLTLKLWMKLRIMELNMKIKLKIKLHTQIKLV